MRYELKRGVETKGISEKIVEHLGTFETSDVCELLMEFATPETERPTYDANGEYAMIYLENNDTLKFAETGDQLNFVEAFRVN